MNHRWFNSVVWGNSIALAWMWGLGLFFSVQVTFMFGLAGLFLFAIPNALGLMLFGWATQILANRYEGGRESLAMFFEKLSKPFGLGFVLYQIIALSLTVFALANYLFRTLEPDSGNMMKLLFLAMAVVVMLGAGSLLGEELGISKIKYGHGLLGIVLLLCIGAILFSLRPLIPENFTIKAIDSGTWAGPSLPAFVVPLLVGLLFGPWMDLQHWQRAIRIHRENTSIRASYIWGGFFFFLLLIFHGFFAAWVLHKTGVQSYGVEGLDGFRYAHQLIVQYIDNLPKGVQGILPAAYFIFLGICVLTTLDSGYIALQWFFSNTLAKSQNLIVGMVPKRVLESPIPTFFVVMVIALIGLFTRVELEYFMVFYASFFVGYEALLFTRCFRANPQRPLPQIRMLSLAGISLVIFAFGYCTNGGILMLFGSVLPLIYVVWLEAINKYELKIPAAEKIAKIKDSTETASSSESSQLATQEARITTVAAPEAPIIQSLGGYFEDKWFVYSFIATYQDTNSVGNIYFGMYGLFVGKARELFFNAAMPDFDLKKTSFYILTRSFEHKFVREAREFDTITVKIRVADFNRKFCTLEHQIYGPNNELLGKGKQSLLFVRSKDYSLLDIPQEVYMAFLPYL